MPGTLALVHSPVCSCRCWHKSPGHMIRTRSCCCIVGTSEQSTAVAGASGTVCRHARLTSTTKHAGQLEIKSERRIRDASTSAVRDGHPCSGWQHALVASRWVAYPAHHRRAGPASHRGARAAPVARGASRAHALQPVWGVGLAVWNGALQHDVAVHSGSVIGCAVCRILQPESNAQTQR